MKESILYVIFIIYVLKNYLILFACYSPDYDFNSLQGSYCTKNKDRIFIICPDYIIRVSDTKYNFSIRSGYSPYEYIKRNYNIAKVGNKLWLREGPASAGKTGARILTRNRLMTGNIEDGWTFFYKISDEEAWHLIESWGYERKKVEEANINPDIQYNDGLSHGEILYDSALKEYKDNKH